MIRLSILAGAAAFAGLLAGAVAAQPTDPNYRAQVQDYQARQQQYQGQVQNYDQTKQAYDAQRQLWFEGLAAYEARYGRGSYDEYARAHPDVTTVVVTPAGKAERRGSTTVIEAPPPPVYPARP